MQEMQETWIQSLGQGDPLEEEMATHSSILAWRIPWAEEPDGLQSTGLQRLGHNLGTKQQTVPTFKIEELIIVVDGDRAYSHDHFVMYVYTESLCCTSESICYCMSIIPQLK